VNRLRRIAEYQAPWVGWIGLALIVALWLLASLVGFAISIAAGLGVSIAFGVFIAGEV
jgi:hypothetical protein